MTQQNQVVAADAGTDNPLLQDWSVTFAVPPFHRIEPEHFRSAFAHAFAEHEAEVAAIAADPDAPSFANTIEALERSGDALTRVENVFYALSGAHTNDAILAIEREIAPLSAKHWDKIRMDEALFRRIYNGEFGDRYLEAPSSGFYRMRPWPDPRPFAIRSRT